MNTDWLNDELIPKIDPDLIKPYVPYVPTRRDRFRWWRNEMKIRLTPIVICKRSTLDERDY